MPQSKFMATPTNPAARLAAARLELAEAIAALVDANDDAEEACFESAIAELNAEIAELTAPVTMDSKVWLARYSVVSGLGMDYIILLATPRNTGLFDLQVTHQGATFTACGLHRDATVRVCIEQAIAA